VVKEGGKEGAPVAAAAVAEGVPPPAAAGSAAAAAGENEKSKVAKGKREEEGGKKEEDSERVTVMAGRGTGGPEDEGAGSDIRSVMLQMSTASVPAVLV
jgi:hypothetical protein